MSHIFSIHVYIAVYETGNPVVPTQDEVLTEMNVNLNEPKPEPVYLRR